MSDVEVLDRSAIVRREVDRESSERALAVMDPSILDTLFASRDPKAIVQRIADVSTVLMDAVHQRDLARRYGDSQSEFLHIEAWQFLSSMLGMTVIGTDSRPLTDGSGWEATAELRHIATGRVLGARDGMAQRTEPSFRRKSGSTPENTIRQMAQLRAARAAARSVLGFVPKIGGFEISDPEGPATKPQVGVLHQLERELGLSHDEGHLQAGVDSYKDLSREQAAELIDTWTALRDEKPQQGSKPEEATPAEDVTAGEVDDARSTGEGVTAAPSSPAVAPHPDDGSFATDAQWARAKAHGLTGAKALAKARRKWPDAGITSQSAITKAQLAQLLEGVM